MLQFAFGTLVLIVFALFESVRWNRGRQNKDYEFQLFPNCLITRFPIVFLDGRKSVFYFGRYWNVIPEFLREHGYEVIELNLPWRDLTERKEELQRFLDVLQSEKVPCHFIMDSSSQDLAPILENFSDQIVRSVNLVDRQVTVPPEVEANHGWAYWLHQFIFNRQNSVDSKLLGLVPDKQIKTIGRSYLELCIDLAESDFQLGASHHEQRPPDAPV